MSNEIKTGIAVILAAGILYWGLNYLGGTGILTSGTEIHAVYDNSSGIMRSQPVTINGVPVGKVSDVEFLPDLSGRILVSMKLTTDYPIPSNTIARIESAGLMGDKEVALIIGNGSALIENGDTLRSELQESIEDAISAEVLPVKIKTEHLLASLDTAVGVLSGFLQGDFQTELYASVSNVNEGLRNLNVITMELRTYFEQNRQELDDMTKNINRTASMIADNREEFDRLMNNLANASDTLAAAQLSKTLEALAVSAERMDRMTAALEAGEGSLGKLVQEDSLYNNLNHTMQSLDRLLLDMRYHPSRYVNFSIIPRRDRTGGQVETDK